MKNIKAQHIFWAAILIAVLLVVVLLGSVIQITNPLMWLAHIIVAAVMLIVGYILGKKSEKDEKGK